MKSSIDITSSHSQASKSRAVAHAEPNTQAQDAFKKKLQAKADAENSNLWQHPFVDVLKHFKMLPGSDWK